MPKILKPIPVIVIHGGSAYDTYEQYLTDLRRDDFDPERDLTKDWKTELGKVLGRRYRVINPCMPNAENAKYLEWAIWFKKCQPYFADGMILVGHSLGSIFLAKYLAENRLPKKVAAVCLVSSPWSDASHKKPLGDFLLPAKFDRLAAYGSRLHFFHSEDDPIVNFASLGHYANALPDAILHIYKNRGHFISPSFPEIVKLIKQLH